MSSRAKQPTVNVNCATAFLDLYSPSRHKAWYGGRGGAKSHHIAEALLVQGHERQHRILCTREFQGSIRESVHHLLAKKIKDIGFADQYDVSVQSIDHRHNGTKFFFYGMARNFDSIRSTEGITRVWVEEAATVTQSSWDDLDPTIREPGSEIWASFNPRFKYDATSQRYIERPPPDVVRDKQHSIIRSVGWRDNPWFPIELQIEMDIMRERDYERYLHVWEGEYKTVTEGAIFGKQLTTAKQQDRVCLFPVEPLIDVDSSWDLGKNDATGVWLWQIVGKEKRAVWYYENRGEEIDHYCKVMAAWLDRTREELDVKTLKYGTHYMPHDVEVKLLGMKNTRKKQFEDGGLKPIRVVQRIPEKQEAIQMARDMFPYVYFHKEHCSSKQPDWVKGFNPMPVSGLDVLANYRYDYDEERNTYKQTPVHDWASNGADAFMQLAQANPKKRRGPTPQPDVRVY